MSFHSILRCEYHPVGWIATVLRSLLFPWCQFLDFTDRRKVPERDQWCDTLIQWDAFFRQPTSLLDIEIPVAVGYFLRVALTYGCGSWVVKSMWAGCRVQKNRSVKINHCCCCCFFPRWAFYVCLTPSVIGFTLVLILTFTMSKMYFNFVNWILNFLVFILILASNVLFMADFTTDCPLLQWSSTFLIIQNGGLIFIER